MGNDHMHFLHNGRINYGNADSQVSQGLQAAGMIACYRNDGHLELSSNHCSLQQVLGLTACAESNKQVTRLAQRVYLARKDILIPVVIGDGGENGSIGCERQDGIRRTLTFEAANQFSSKVLCFSSTATITGNQHLVPSPQRLNEPLCRFIQSVSSLHKL